MTGQNICKQKNADKKLLLCHKCRLLNKKLKYCIRNDAKEWEREKATCWILNTDLREERLRLGDLFLMLLTDVPIPQLLMSSSATNARQKLMNISQQKYKCICMYGILRACTGSSREKELFRFYSNCYLFLSVHLVMLVVSIFLVKST